MLWELLVDDQPVLLSHGVGVLHEQAFLQPFYLCGGILRRDRDGLAVLAVLAAFAGRVEYGGAAALRPFGALDEEAGLPEACGRFRATSRVCWSADMLASAKSREAAATTRAFSSTAG